MPVRMIIFILMLIAAPAYSQITTWQEALADLGHATGVRRERAQAWLVDQLELAQVAPFLNSFPRRRDEVWLRGLQVLAARPDLFPALADLVVAPRTPADLARAREAVRAVMEGAVTRGHARPQQFIPYAAAILRLGPHSRLPLELAGLLARNLEMPLPLLVWPGGLRARIPVTKFWGGDTRVLLEPKKSLTWFGNKQVLVTKDALVLHDSSQPVPRTLPAMLTTLLDILRERPLPEKEEAALALGQLPFAPLGSFLLSRGAREKSGPGPMGLGLAVFARRNGFTSPDSRLAWKTLRRNLAQAKGETLAWTALALSSFGTISGVERGKDLMALGRELAPQARWRAMLPAIEAPFPELQPWLRQICQAGPGNPREAALMLRALGFLADKSPLDQVRRAVSLAGPGTEQWSAGLVAPLSEADLQVMKKDLFASDSGLAELAAAALALTPDRGWAALAGAVEMAKDPVQLACIIGGLRLAGDRGGGGSLVPWLLARYRRSTGEQQLALAIALGLVIDLGRHLTIGNNQLLERGIPVRTWEVQAILEVGFKQLGGRLRKCAASPTHPFGTLAARSLGRLWGLWQAISVHDILAWGLDPRLQPRLLLCLREVVARSPYCGMTLRRGFRYFERQIPLVRRGTKAFMQFKGEVMACALGLRPPVGAGMNLETEDPLAWALAFPNESTGLGTGGK